jgi:hypothetical protein
VGALFAALRGTPFLGRFLGSGLYTAFAALALTGASAAFIYVNYKALKLIRPGAAPDPVQGCIDRINGYISSNIQTFRPDLMELAEQLEKLQRKKEAVRQTLMQRFDPGGATFAKFSQASRKAEGFLVQNAQDILAKVEGFDEEEYEDVMNSPGTSREEFRARKQIYDSVLTDVADRVGQGDRVLLALDKLMAAVSDIAAIGGQQPDSDTAVREIDGLIQDTRYYRDA